ncbi:Signal peptide peptidase 2 [Cercospora beticola]|uniref:Signal peptide peptidase 2 n=1 Tax=Cercospora beticola TaxID=122368 RepID=A0A2G5I7T5_CERBT|nr:Signal peptide peptidase 2 [Cercospora beticola]PIB00792.1 Signal peptide peptidase 2 [Cercospora beticola]WPA97251.1 hypothetical protein RHO25_001860 [Cercospora beticola]
MAAVDTREMLAAVARHWHRNRPLLPMYAHLLLSAVFAIYTGAHASLSRPASAAKAGKSETSTTDSQEDDEEDDDEEDVQQIEGLTPKDAVIFPLMAGLVLAGLYWLINTYGADIINTILGLYFSLIGTYSVAKLISDSWTMIASFLMPDYFSDQGKLWKVSDEQQKVFSLDQGSTLSRDSPFPGLLGRLPLPEALSNFSWSLRQLSKHRYQIVCYAKGLCDFKVVLTRHDAISAVIGFSAILYSLFFESTWWLTNLQGFAVSYGALQLMSPTTFATGTLILSGLFCYDIWAVFCTPLMVTVAKNLDVPIKMLFPRPEEGYSMLGLGDIVLPGLYIGLCLRYDLFMHYLRKQKQVQKQHCEGDVCTLKTEVEKVPYVPVTGNWGERLWTMGSAHKALPAALSTRFSKPYFTAAMIGYAIGMVATLVFMSVFQHAQPALLYLVPGVLISTWGTGLVRGELKDMWQYSEEITGEAATEDKEKEKEGEAKPSKGFFAELWAELFGSADDDLKKEKKQQDESVDKQEHSEKARAEPPHLLSFTIQNYKRGAKKAANRHAASSQDSGNAAGEASVLDANPSEDDASSRLRQRVKTGERTRS